MRTTARETAFKLVFASRFTGEFDGELEKMLKKSERLDCDDCDYVNRVLAVLSEHESEFLKIIDDHSTYFPESRLFPADKSVLLIAIAEIKYMDDIPAVVSVNEAANISSKYSSAKSASFISGILSDIIKEQQCTNS